MGDVFFPEPLVEDFLTTVATFLAVPFGVVVAFSVVTVVRHILRGDDE